jgi:protein required for attachment to host cells
MKAEITWILIADGAQAKVLEHCGPGEGLKPVDGLTFHQEHLMAREIMADRPGRSYSSKAPGTRSAMEYTTDPVAERERKFVEHVAEELEKRRLEHAFDRLIVAAAPTALGHLRAAFSKNLRETIVAELPKDLNNTPSAQLEAHFAGLLPV